MCEKSKNEKETKISINIRLFTIILVANIVAIKKFSTVIGIQFPKQFHDVIEAINCIEIQRTYDRMHIFVGENKQ